MFKALIDAIKNLFVTIFGSKKTTESPRPTPKPQTAESEAEIPQDASEVQADSLVIVANEMDRIILPPDTASDDLDHDIFDEPTQPAEETPVVDQPQHPTPPTPIETEPEVVLPKPGTDIPQHQPRYLWCLDNGHGKKTPGKRSPVFDDGKTQFFEYEFNRDIVKRITKELEALGVKYFITVPEVDIDDFLAGRVERANNKKSNLPKLFVSVHSNAAPAASASSWGPPTVSGVETWFYHGSQRGQKLAAVFQKYLIDATGFKNRHIKSKPEGQFYVLRKTNMTAVLTENGFYNNKKEAIELMKDDVRQKIADAHVRAIMEIEKDGL